jgi:hypothetical protein
MTRSAAPPASPTLPPRDLAIESNSSKKSTQGAAERAFNSREVIVLNNPEIEISHLVENIPNVGFRFTKPHGEQFWSLDRDEVGLAFIRNRLSEQGFAATRWAVEEHTSRWLHAELEEFFGVLHRVLHQLLQLPLDILETTDILPRDVGNLNNCLAQSAGTALAHGVLYKKGKIIQSRNSSVT